MLPVFSFPCFLLHVAHIIWRPLNLMYLRVDRTELILHSSVAYAGAIGCVWSTCSGCAGGIGGGALASSGAGGDGTVVRVAGDIGLAASGGQVLCAADACGHVGAGACGAGRGAAATEVH